MLSLTVSLMFLCGFMANPIKQPCLILTRHFYDMSNMMSKNEGVWLSNGWMRALLWIFFPCFLYTVISIVYLVASYIDQ